MIGLRIYSKDPDLRIEVVEPGKGEETGLDIDDTRAEVVLQVSPGGNGEEIMELPLRPK
jgi:hypothetical protein